MKYVILSIALLNSISCFAMEEEPAKQLPYRHKRVDQLKKDANNIDKEILQQDIIKFNTYAAKPNLVNESDQKK